MLFLQFLVWIGAWAGVWYAIVRFEKLKDRPAWLRHIAGGVLGLFVSLVVLAVVLPTPPSDTSKATVAAAAPTKATVRSPEEKQKDRDSDLSMEACERAKDAVLARLKAPSTADFPGCVFGAHKYEIRADDKRTIWYVKGYVDSQNSYGAMLRSNWIVKLSRSGPADKEKWGITKVVID